MISAASTNDLCRVAEQAMLVLIWIIHFLVKWNTKEHQKDSAVQGVLNLVETHVHLSNTSFCN